MRQVSGNHLAHLGIQPVFLGNLANGNEAIWCYLTGSDARNDRKSAITLNIAQETVIGILVLMMCGGHDMFVVPGQVQISTTT